MVLTGLESGNGNGTAPSREEVQEEIDALFRLTDEGAGELLLIRHAQPVRAGVDTCSSDQLLSCTGLEQAERLAERLSGLWIEAVYASPERRALQTARVLAEAVDRPVEVIEELGEIEFEPGALVAAGRPESRPAQRFVLEPRWDAVPGLENSRLFRRRCIQAIESTIALHPARRVAVVTHASVINAYLSMLLGIARDQFFAPEFASISVVRWQEDMYAVRSLNDVSHLGPMRSYRI